MKNFVKLFSVVILLALATASCTKVKKKKELVNNKGKTFGKVEPEAAKVSFNEMTGEVPAFKNSFGLIPWAGAGFYLSSGTCEPPEVGVYDLDEYKSDKIAKPLKTAKLNDDTSFKLENLEEAGYDPKKPYVLAVSGCDKNFTRIVTTPEAQDLTVASTVVAYGAFSGENSAKTFEFDEDTLVKLDEMMASLSKYTNSSEVYAKLAGSSELSKIFKDTFSIDPDKLNDVAPKIIAINMPEKVEELVPAEMFITAAHWDPTYEIAYLWRLDGVDIGTSSSFSYTPSANSQGTFALQVFVGKKQLDGTIDFENEYRTFAGSQKIGNAVSATSPDFSVISDVGGVDIPVATSTTINFAIDTGVALANCASISKMIIMETANNPPTDPESFTISCDTDLTQTGTYTLTDVTNGLKTLYLWSMDKANIISLSPKTAVFYYDNGSSPGMTISNPPTGQSPTTALDITVGATNATHYKYKVGLAASVDCTNSAGYSTEVALATHITSNISATADGNMVVCVIGKKPSGAWQNATDATSATWTKDTTAPTATISGQPTGTNATSTLSITVAGADVTYYKHKVGLTSVIDCSAATGYGAETAIATLITNTLSSDGPTTLCVIGRDLAGNWQAAASATTASWTRDATAPTATLSGAPTSTNNTTTLAVTVAGTDVVNYKYKVGLTASISCSNSGSYVGPVAVGTAITTDISGLADGAMTLCVIGADSTDNWQALASATSASWTKDTTPPTVTFTGAPTGTNNTVTLAVTAGGTDVTHYKYKVGATSSTTCSNSADYSATEIAVATNITADISSIGDVAITLCAIGRDTTGNWQALGSATSTSWTKDATAPTATISGEPTGTNSTSTLAITVAGTDVTHYKFKVGLTASTTCSNSSGYSATEVAVATAITSTLSSDGATTLCVIGRDTVGNWQAYASATTASWTRDATAPTATLSGAPTSTNNTTTLAVTVAGTDVVTYKYKVGLTASTDCSNATGYSASPIAIATDITNDISGVADGAMKLCVIGADVTGNWQALASATSATWTKDTTAPTATLSGQPTGTNNVVTLAVTVGGTDVTHYKYKVGATSSTTCSNSGSYSASEVAIATNITSDISGIADVGITLCVIGRDASGNWQDLAAATSATWTKDTTATTVTLTGTPTGSSNTVTLAITAGGTDVTHYKYKVGATGSTTCSSATDYSASEVAVATDITSSISGVADGGITICAIGRDASGNWQALASATTASWTKDTVAPTSSVSGQPTGTNSTSTLSITVAGTGVTHYKHKVGLTGSTTCSVALGYGSETAIADLIVDVLSTDGATTLCVIGRDAAGNWQDVSSATTATWTRDATPPTATLSGAPTSTNKTTTLAVTVAGTDVVTYKYKVGLTASTDCSNATGYSASPIAVATDITDDISGVADGAMKLCVIGADVTGNWQALASATSATWTKDTTAPTATVSGQPTGTNSTSTLAITVAGTGVTHYKHKVGLTASTTCAVALGYGSETAIADLIVDVLSTDGATTLCVIGRDAAGNWQDVSTATTATWTRDATPPTATLSGQPTSTNNTTTLAVTVAGTDVVTYKYKVGLTASTDCSNATGYSASPIVVATDITNDISGVADGAMKLCVIGADVTGNWQALASATSATWTKDTAAPTATLSGEPTGTNNTVTLAVTVAGTDVTHYKYKVGATSSTTCSNSGSYSGTEIAVGTNITSDISGLADVGITLCVIGRDASGNWQDLASATSASWTKDASAPTATISGEPTGTNSTSTLAITVAGTDVTHYKFKVGLTVSIDCSNSSGYSGTEVAVATAITSTLSTDGATTLCVIGRDASGNWQALASATTASWTRDATPPTATLTGAPSSTNNTTTLAVTVAGTDVVTYKYKVGLTASTDCSNATGYSASPIVVATGITNDISGVADGAMTLCAIGADSTGNWQALASATTATWTKDTTAPTATLSGQPTGTNNTVTLAVTVAGTDVTHYKYKVGATSSTTCSDSGSYSGTEVAVGTNITSDISGIGDVAITLCVIGRDAQGNWQALASATSASWTKDATAPTATISGEPTGTNTSTSITVTVAGTDVTHYKYKVGVSGSTDCSNSASYSGTEAAVAADISASISGLADGAIKLCVVGRDTNGNYQAYASATSATWTKDTVAPSVTGVASTKAAGSYTTGETVSIQVTYDEAVTVVTTGGTPTLLLETGSTDRSATYASGSGTTVLNFTYTVVAGDQSADLDANTTAPQIALNSGTMKDGAGNNASLTLPTGATAGSLSGNNAIIIDALAPVVGTSTMTPSNALTDTVTITWTKATDGIAAQSALQYLAYYSTSNNMTTVANAEANGTASGSYTADIATKNVSGLFAGTTYYFTVVVKDIAGNKSVYGTGTVATAQFCGGAGTVGDPYQVCTLASLQNVHNFLNKYFKVTVDIDASASQTWNSGAGFNPIGTGTGTGFYGVTFDGDNKTISNLYINRPSTDSVGLFQILWSNSTIKNVKITNATITGRDNVGGITGFAHGITENNSVNATISGRSFVGGIVGRTYGNQTGNSTSGTVTGSSSAVGGIVGYSQANTTTHLCSSSATVTGTAEVGGIVGGHYGTITNSYTTGDVTGSGTHIGGVAGWSSTTVNNSFATGFIRSTAAGTVGGLVGGVGGPITHSFATGNVSGTGSGVGGLGGYYTGGGVLNDSFATGNAYGPTNPGLAAGGLIGYSQGGQNPEKVIRRVFATGNASSMYYYAGGIVGGLFTDGELEDSIGMGHVHGDWLGSGGLAGTVGAGSQYTRSIAKGRVTGAFYGQLVGYNPSTITPTLSLSHSISGGGTPAACYHGAAACTYTSSIGYTKPYVSIGFSDEIVSGRKVGSSDKAAYMMRGRCGSWTNTIVVGLAATDGVNSVSTTTTCLAGNWSKALDLSTMDDGTNNITVTAEYRSSCTTGVNCPTSSITLSKVATFCDGNPSSGSFAGGAGTVGDPFTICTATQLSAMRGGQSSGTYYKLMNNINFAASSMAPMNDGSSAYAATFDGNGFVIKNLVTYSPTVSYVSVFGKVTGTLKNLGVEDTYMVGNAYVGLLAGQVDGATIQNCYSTGAVMADSKAGGLIGSIVGSSVVTTSYSLANLVGWDSDAAKAGGFAGEITSSSIDESYARGSSTGFRGGYVGGFAGETTSATIEDSYATGSSITASDFAGGFIGQATSTTLTRVYAAGDVINTGAHSGGLIGNALTSTAVTDSYAAGSLIGASEVGGLIGKLDSSSTLTRTYAVGHVLSAGANVGGLVAKSGTGTPTVVYSFATGDIVGGSVVGAVMGYNSATSSVTNTMWFNHSPTPNQCAGTDDNSGVTACTADNAVSYFKTNASGLLTNWDFTGGSGDGSGDYWKFPAGGGFPVLNWQ